MRRSQQGASALLLIFGCLLALIALGWWKHRRDVEARELQEAQQKAQQAAARRLSAAELCRRDLKALIDFRDPDSVQVGKVYSNAEANSDGTIDVTLMVNAKNGFGGYTGFQGYSCSADERTQRAVFASPVVH